MMALFMIFYYWLLPANVYATERTSIYQDIISSHVVNITRQDSFLKTYFGNSDILWHFAMYLNTD